MTQKRVLAIHDISCMGRCSITVALPILSSAGVETTILPTAVLSTHTAGFEGYTYLDMAQQMSAICAHWKRLDEHFHAIYTGFLGSPEQIDLVSAVIDDFQSRDTFVLVDPVMADSGMLYPVFTTDMALQMKRLCRKADMMIPNLTEAAFLLDEPYVGLSHDEFCIRELLKRLTGLGCAKILLTGVSLRPGRLGAACYDAQTDTFFYHDGSYVDQIFHGTGDVFGSGLLAAMMNGFAFADAMAVAVDYTRVCIDYTMQEGRAPHYGPCFERATPFLLHRLGIE